jgi:cytochrome c-type biogenesis protein
VDALLSYLGNALNTGGWIAPLLALAAGVLTSLTPCSLSSIPLIIGVVGGTNAEPKRAFRLSLLFAAGAALTFTILGTAAALAGNLIGMTAKWWYLILGILMVLMALQTWELFTFIPSTWLTSRNKYRGYPGALLAGILGGLFSSPCATPALVALLAVVANSGNIAWGILLMLCYGIGHGTLSVVAGSSVSLTRRIAASGRYGRFSVILKWGMGFLILLIGFYMFYLGF